MAGTRLSQLKRILRVGHTLARVAGRYLKRKARGRGATASPKHKARPTIPKEWTRKLSHEEINKLKMIAFEGPIHLVVSHEEMVKAVADLGREQLLGFDTETKPAFKRGEHHDTALLQLVGSHGAYLFRLNALRLPKELTTLLSRKDIIKAGVAVVRDVRELQAMTHFVPHGFVDLGLESERLGIQHHGLRGLAACVLGCRISKSGQLTNWERTDLPASAQQYAATDAWIGRRIYEEITRFAKLKEMNLTQPPTEPRSRRSRGRRSPAHPRADRSGVSA